MLLEKITKAISVVRLNDKFISRKHFGFFVTYNRDNTINPNFESGFNKKKLILSDISFNDTQEVFQCVQTTELIRRFLILSSFKIPGFAKYSENMYKISNKILGKMITRYLIEKTVFRHFCGGKNIEELLIRAEDLSKHKLGAIIDYAAESDDSIADLTNINKWFEINIELTKKAVDASELLTTNPDYRFIAAKVTCLCNPLTLRKITTALNFVHFMFGKCIGDINISNLIIPTNHSKYLDNNVTKEQFIDCCRDVWPNVNILEFEKLFESGVERFNKSTKKNQQIRTLDYIAWTELFDIELLSTLPAPIIKECQVSTDNLKNSWVTDVKEEWNDSIKRLHDLTIYATNKNVKLLLDAEQTFIQPACDAMGLFVMKLVNNLNHDNAFIYNTYQMYLKNSLSRLECDIKRSELNNFKFAAKLVRGAYMAQETDLSQKLSYDNPVHDNIENTHESYNSTHNEVSIKKAVELMEKLSICPNTAPIAFAQLVGMCDHISLTLARASCRTFKYVPYGPIDAVIPYLIRRAQENSSVLSGASEETRLMFTEIKRRLTNFT